MRRLLLAVVMITAVVVPSQAFADNGNDIYRFCKAENNSAQWGVCMGYVVGVSEVLSSEDGLNGLRACFPDNYTRGQAKGVVVKYLEDSPEDRHAPAWGIVAIALSKAYPCEKR